MSVKLQLFKYESIGNNEVKQWPELFMGYKLFVFHPNIFSLAKYGESWFINMLWYIFTLGNFKIICLLDKDNLVHYSYITSKIFRFPFMKPNDIQIGPCITNYEYQKKGIFTGVLKLIIDIYSSKNESIWIYTNMTNEASKKAFERSGFTFFSLVKMSRWTKILRIIK